MDDKELKRLKKELRNQQLEHEKTYGKLRSNSWGGKPDAEKQRRESKRQISRLFKKRDYDFEDD